MGETISIGGETMTGHYTGRDHIASAFGGARTDRIPVRTMQSFIPVLDRAGVTPKEVRTQPEKFVKAMVTLYDVVPQDGITMLVGDPGLFAELFGVSFQELKERGMGGLAFGEGKRLTLPPMPDIKSYERLHYYQEICNLADKELPETTIDAMSVSPWSTAMMMRGIENTIYDTKEDPERVHELLRFTTEFAKLVARGLVEANIGCLTIADPSAGCSVISPKMFRKWVQPYLQETIDYVRQYTDKPICLHICGYTDPIMEDLVSMGVDGISIDAPASLAKMVEASQGKVAVIGNFAGETYVEGTREEIERRVRESIDTAAAPSDYRYILCSGCQVPDNAPLENVIHFLECGRRYGSYSERR